MLEQEVKQAADKIARLLEELTGREWLVEGTCQHTDWEFRAYCGSFRRQTSNFDIRQGEPLLPRLIGIAVCQIHGAWFAESIRVKELLSYSPVSEENYHIAVARCKLDYEDMLEGLQARYETERRTCASSLVRNLGLLERAYREWQGGQNA